MSNRGGEAGPQMALPRLTPAVKVILIVVAAFFVFGLFDDHGWIGTHSLLIRWAALSPGTVDHGQVWRLFTYPLVNPVGADVMPVVWGAIAIYFFGPDLEDYFGRNRFLLFLGASVFLAGFFSFLLGLFPSFAVPIFGLNLLSLSLTAAWGARFPNRRLFFPPVSGKWLVVGLLGLELILMLAKSRGDAAASIAAIGVGFVLARYWTRIDALLDRVRLGRAKSKRARALRAIRGGLDDRGAKRPADKRFLN